MTKYPDLSSSKIIAVDTETTGLCYPLDKAFCFSYAVDGKSGYYDLRDDPNAGDWLIDQCRGKLVIAHNASFDHRMLSSAGIYVDENNWDDTCVRAVQIDEHVSTIFPWTKGAPGNYSLDYLCQRYLGERKTGDELYARMAEALGGLPTRNVQMAKIALAPRHLVEPYAIQDAVLCLRLWQWQEDEIERQGLRKICDFERKVMPLLIRAEKRGIDIDEDYADQAHDKMTGIIEEHKIRMVDAAGFNINVNSSAHLRELFKPAQDASGKWFAQDGTPLGITGGGKPSIGSKELRAMRDPRGLQIVDLKAAMKTRDTFIVKHVQNRIIGGKVYPSIHQSKGEYGGTGTGRLSYSGPAMQQIPSRNKAVAAIVKPMFIPPQGMYWLDSDMASFEVRIFAHLVAAYNPALAKVYRDAPLTDFHQYVADLTGLPRDASFAGERSAKQLDLSIIFNSGNGAIAEQMGLPWEWDSFTDNTGKVITYKRAGREALDMLDMYHEKVPGVRKLAARAKYVAESRGHLVTRDGRHLRFPRGYKAYKASPILIQSTSADENKRNWLLIEEALGDDGHIILNTHDSYSMAVEPNWKPIWARVKAKVERNTLRAPLILDWNGTGNNWWEALQKKDLT